MLAIHDLLRPFQVLCCWVVRPQTAEMQLDIRYMNSRRETGSWRRDRHNTPLLLCVIVFLFSVCCCQASFYPGIGAKLGELLHNVSLVKRLSAASLVTPDRGIYAGSK